MKINRLLLSLAIAVIAAASADSQNVNTPYSRYGYGLLGDYATSAQRAMGGVGYAMNSGRQINVMNPASYAAIDSLTFLFDIGADINNLWTNEGNNKGTKLGGGLDYITIQVPLTRYGGASAGFVPYSQVGYSFGDDIENGLSTYEGNGGISQLYLGFAFRPFKGFTIGANVGYLFGNIEHNNYTYVGSSSSIGLFQRQMEVSDYSISLGVQYSLQINRKNRVTVGATFSPEKSFHGHSYAIAYDASLDNSADTIASFNMAGRYTQPMTIGAGINWQWNDRLTVEIDGTYQPWSKAKYQSLDEYDVNRFVNRYKMAVGAQYLANPRGDYLHRIQWRAGFSYTRDYWQIRGNTINQYGIHAGVGLPAPGSKTMINVSLEYQHRQATPNPLVKEKYLFVTLGVNFNELWFWQNKIR